MQDFDGHFMQGSMNIDNIAKVRLSTLVNKSNPPSMAYNGTLGVLTGATRLRSVWSIAEAGTSVALYSDSKIDNVFGIAPLTTDGGGMWFYPHADGAPDHAYAVGSDFRIMEDYLCWRLAAERFGTSAGADDFCGGIDVPD